MGSLSRLFGGLSGFSLGLLILGHLFLGLLLVLDERHVGGPDLVLGVVVSRTALGEIFAGGTSSGGLLSLPARLGGLLLIGLLELILSLLHLGLSLSNGLLLSGLGLLVGDGSGLLGIELLLGNLLSSLGGTSEAKNLVLLVISKLLGSLLCSFSIFNSFGLSSLIGFLLLSLSLLLSGLGILSRFDKSVLLLLMLGLLVLLALVMGLELGVLLGEIIGELLSIDNTVLGIGGSVSLGLSFSSSLGLVLLRGRKFLLLLAVLGLILLILLGDITLGLGGGSSGVSSISLGLIFGSLTSSGLITSLLIVFILSMLLGFLRVFLGVLVGLLVVLLPVDGKLKELGILNFVGIELDGLADLGVGEGAD